MDLAVDIPVEEWREAAALMSFAEGDERSVLAMVLLTSDGSRRRWWVTDRYRMATELGGADDQEYRVLVSPRLIQLATHVSRTVESVELVVGEEDGAHVVTVRTPEVSLSVAADLSEYPPVDEMLTKQLQATGASFQVEAPRLSELVMAARVQPIAHDPDDPVEPLFWLGLDGGALEIHIAWPSLGSTSYRLVGTGGSGHAEVAVSPAYLSDALGLFEGDISLVVPSDPAYALRVHGGSRTALIMPINTTFENQREGVEAVLTEVFGTDVVHVDHDGDYLLSTVDGMRVHGRLVDDEPVRLQIFGVVVAGVEKSHGLLEELNDYNSTIGFARAFWVDDQVLVEVDLVAATLDPAEVSTAFERIADIGRLLGPMIAALYGGELVVNDENDRWEDYHEAIIEAEAIPAGFVPLNGPDALAAWPYPGTVHVVTAWNPRGRTRSKDANERDANLLVAMLHENGYGFHRANVGSGDDWEEGVAVWGLDLDSARSLGRRFQQDAIFELDEDEVRIVGCFVDRLESQPRQGVVESSD